MSHGDEADRLGLKLWCQVSRCGWTSGVCWGAVWVTISFLGVIFEILFLVPKFSGLCENVGVRE